MYAMLVLSAGGPCLSQCGADCDGRMLAAELKLASEGCGSNHSKFQEATAPLKGSPNKLAISPRVYHNVWSLHLGWPSQHDELLFLDC